MPKEKQKMMKVQEGKLELVDVKSEKEIIERITFSTVQAHIRINTDKLEEIKNKIQKQKNDKKKHLLADIFIQSKIKLNRDMVYAEKDFDENWQKLKTEIFGEIF